MACTWLTNCSLVYEKGWMGGVAAVILAQWWCLLSILLSCFQCTTYAPMIVKDVLAGFDPELTCEKVRLCTSK
jgi:hypothetical protein